MPDLAAPDYQVARFLIERGLAAIYAIAFLVAWNQFPALCGERGLEPVPRFLELVPRFRDAPTIFRWIGYSDAKLRVIAAAGMAMAAGLLVGLPESLRLPPEIGLVLTMAAWFALWVLYQSIVNVGGTFYGFGWETLLLEAGFLAIFLGNDAIAPPLPLLLAYRWLAFRVEFGAGLIKLRGDRCWRDLTCMEFHHETQPMPNPLSWFFHHLPRPLHRIEALGNFAAQLVLPFGLFLPQPFATIVAVLMIATQLYLVVSGNYAWLNWVTIVVMTAALADPVLRVVVPGLAPVPAAGFVAPPAWFVAAIVGVAIVIVVLSVRPVQNLLSQNQAMNASFDPFRLVNTYGAFGSVSRVRDEVVVEGTDDETVGPETTWREYEFKGKPGDVRRMPRQWAPYHLRLDWLLWFLPLSSRYGERWFVPFLIRLLEGDRPTLRLLRANPFPDRAPRFIRALLYRYRFTTWQERRETGAWWVRTLIGEYVRPNSPAAMSSITPRADVLWLAEYLYWLRDRILAIAGGLTDAEFLGTPAINGRDLRATLVHELDVEIGWRARLQGEPPNRWNDESTLHPEAFPSLAAIEQRWRADEAEMRGWLSGLTEADLARPTTTSGLEGYGLGIYLMHAVEHGVGEFTNAAAILTAIGRSPGDLGLLDALDDLAPMPPGDDGNAE